MNQPAVSSKLTRAVEDAYAVFATYSPGAQLATCRCPQCMDDETEQRLLTTPPRDIDQELLSEYTWSANGRNDLTYNPDELRYFLPRYFELIAAGEYPCSDPEPTLRQLGQIGFRTSWPTHEIKAIDDFFSALLACKLSQPIRWYETQTGETKPSSDILDDLCLMVTGGGDMAQLLALWEQDPSGEATAHLAASVKFQLWAFWGDIDEPRNLLITWLFSDAAAERLRHAALIEGSTELGNLLRESSKPIPTEPPAREHPL